MKINHNIAALNTHRQLGNNNNAVQNSLEKLSSGLQINKAADDAAGLAISEKMRGQIRGLEQAQNNAQDGISLIQTAEGALSETQDILQRMRELAVQSSNDTNTDSDRNELQKELNQLTSAINDISNNTEFNTKKLLTGDFEGTFHVGANAGQNLKIKIGDMSAGKLAVETNFKAGVDGKLMSTDENPAEVGTFVEKGADALAATEDNPAIKASVSGYYDAEGALVLGADEAYAENAAVSTGINISSQEKADEAIETIQSAIDNVSAERSKLGAVQNRLDHTINNLGASAENLTAAESRIRDVDYAEAA